MMIEKKYLKMFPLTNSLLCCRLEHKQYKPTESPKSSIVEFEEIYTSKLKPYKSAQWIVMNMSVRDDWSGRWYGNDSDPDVIRVRLFDW
jgi:hypothetical protein